MDNKYKRYDGQFPDDLEPAKALLLEAFAAFPHWAQLATILADHASERIDEAEQKAMFHDHYGRAEEARRAKEWIPMYDRMHRLAHLIRHVDMLGDAEAVVAAVVARHAPKGAGTKGNPIDVTPGVPAKRKGKKSDG